MRRRRQDEAAVAEISIRLSMRWSQKMAIMESAIKTSQEIQSTAIRWSKWYASLSIVAVVVGEDFYSGTVLFKANLVDSAICESTVL